MLWNIVKSSVIVAINLCEFRKHFRFITNISHTNLPSIFFCRFNCRHFHLDGVFYFEQNLWYTKCIQNCIIKCIYLYLYLLTIMRVLFPYINPYHVYVGVIKRIMTDWLISYPKLCIFMFIESHSILNLFLRLKTSIPDRSQFCFFFIFPLKCCCIILSGKSSRKNYTI